jgi:putative FmdB family regulatory protein
MPTYEYECTRCGQITEEFKPMSAPKRQRCPHCRGKVERLISGGLGVVFKGSGFYINDSRSKNKTPKANDSSKTTADKT